MNFIRTRSRRKVVALVAIAMIVLSLTATGGKTSAAASERAEQVIFSGIGIAREGFVATVGFWIWCAAEGNGPYAENHTCKGALYVYRLGLDLGVHGYITKEADGTYTMHVFSNKEGLLEATLHNVSADVQHGPNNTVEFDVFTEAGLSRGNSTDSVVIVSGPPE